MTVLADNAGNSINYYETVFGGGTISYGSHIWQGWEHPFYNTFPLLAEQQLLDGSIVAAWYEPSGQGHWFNEWHSYLEGIYVPLVG